MALRAEHKSAETLRSYGNGVRSFVRWCDDNGHTPALDRELVKGWVADLLDGGAEPATARARQLAVRRFSAFLADEGEIDTDPLLGLKAPKLDAKVTDITVRRRTTPTGQGMRREGVPRPPRRCDRAL